MDKNKIKSFAIWARRNLIAAVSEKANRIGIFENKIEEATAVQGGFIVEGKEELYHFPKSHRDALVSQVRKKGFEQVMEEVAYTWFNRFIGLRYMEVNNYLPIGMRILSSEIKDKSEPDALTKVFSLVDDLNLEINKVENLISDTDENGAIKTTTQKHIDTRELYKYLITRQCNELGKIIPQMFEKISDYTELLLPDNLLEEGSVIRRMVEDIEESDWLEDVEIVGWMYQYYVSEKKVDVDEKIRKGKKVSKENLPVKTQIFTPKWIVKYMVENSISSAYQLSLDSNGEYDYLATDIDSEKLVKNIEDIKIIDPCQGSGHILLYAFDVLYNIYKSNGYSEREIPLKIISKNIYGLDIDKRATQLATFALIMKARHYNRRLFREINKLGVISNITYIEESNEIDKETLDYFLKDNEELREDLEYIIKKFENAKQYGSLLKLKEINFDLFLDRVKEIEDDHSLFFADHRFIILDKLKNILIQARILADRYDAVITNPPYLGKKKGMNKELCEFVEEEYEKSKMDLFSAFIERSFLFAKKDGYISLVTPYSWMFLTSYKELRKEIIENKNIVSLIQLNGDTFNDATVSTCCFTIKNKNDGRDGLYIRLSGFSGDEQELKLIEAFKSLDNNYTFKVNQKLFKSIPDYRVAYWADENIEKCFEEKLLGDVIDIKSGMFTSDNDRFLRIWHEVDLGRVNFNCKHIDETNQNEICWYPYNKGGKKTKWYGNNEYVINWGNNGQEVKAFAASKYKTYTRSIKNMGYFFKRCITWSDISGTDFAARACGIGFIFDVKGSCAFPEEKEYNIILALMNSKVLPLFINILNPTVTTQVGDLKQIPLINISLDNKKKIDLLVKECVELAKWIWDRSETSWDFMRSDLCNNSGKIEDSYKSYEKKYNDVVYRIKSNEDKINTILLLEYGFENKLEESSKNNFLNREENIKQLISYSVGCIFGRYSIDHEGLIYAGGKLSDKLDLENNKVRKIEKDDEGNIIVDSWINSRFMTDKDNIIPITEDEYFEDDIVSRFIEFVKIVYGNETLEENLDFIADSIGRKASETSRQAIRRYFIKDFYKDHLKVYQKRPIYWMFESGKNDGFKCLIYMHRYNDQTVAKVRTDYLHTLQRKYESEINRLQLVVDSEEYTAKDRTTAKKKIDRISKQLEECKEYDQVVAYLANEQIEIDLDDGVKVNYAKFQDVKVINSKGKEVKMNLLAKI